MSNCFEDLYGPEAVRGKDNTLTGNCLQDLYGPETIAGKTNSLRSEKTDFEYPKEKFYLFTFVDESRYEMKCGISFKDALWEMAKYTGESSELLLKSLNGFEESDIDGIVALFNHFAYHDIEKVYIVDEVLYETH